MVVKRDAVLTMKMIFVSISQRNNLNKKFLTHPAPLPRTVLAFR